MKKQKITTVQDTRAASASCKVGVVIVTHNSQAVIGKCIDCLRAQTFSNWVAVVVDSGSQDPGYLDMGPDDPRINTMIVGENVGFCKGNNLGYAALPAGCSYILFLNPDAFLPEDFLTRAVEYMEDPRHTSTGILTGQLLGYNVADKKPTGLIDSTGIFRTWYGRWFDRDQGRPAANIPEAGIEKIPAICGALMFCRDAALQQTQVADGQVFDNAFYMYKEDIDLSLRMRAAGWSLAYLSSLTAYHCRGWARDRYSMPRRLRLLSARNDIRLCMRHTPGNLGYALAKYLYVRWLEK